jgi:hypothetical protein
LIKSATLTTKPRRAAFFDAWEALGSTKPPPTAGAAVWLYAIPAGVVAVAIPGYGITIGCSGMNVAGVVQIVWVRGTALAPSHGYP